MLVTGSPGGRTIINTVFKIVLDVVEYGLTGREAVDLARTHHQWLPDRASLEPGTEIGGDDERAQGMGHEVRMTAQQGDAHSIWIGPDGTAFGVADKRTAGRESLGPGWFDSAHGRTVGLSECSRAAPSPAPSRLPHWRAGRVLRALIR